MRRIAIVTVATSLALAGLVLYELFPWQSIMSTPLDRFSGGPGDGYQNTLFLQNSQSPPLPSKRFAGDHLDGFAEGAYFANIQTPPVSPSRFSGGERDGYALVELFPNGFGTSQPPVRFTGGAFDGHDVSLIIGTSGKGYQSTARFAGGPFDGHTALVWLRATPDTYHSGFRFSGGFSDGYAFELMPRALVSGSSPAMRFWGGPFDGHTAFVLLSSGSILGNLSPRYFGGSLHGYAVGLVRVPVPQIAVDSDQDDLADWWEVKWYTNITTVTSLDDTDHDGANAWSEYVAGTDPTRQESVFRIEYFDVLPQTITVAYQCFDSRVYTLQCACNLTTAAWSNQPGYTRMSGPALGFATNTIAQAPSNVMYRIVVDFP